MPPAVLPALPPFSERLMLALQSRGKKQGESSSAATSESPKTAATAAVAAVAATTESA